MFLSDHNPSQYKTWRAVLCNDNKPNASPALADDCWDLFQQVAGAVIGNVKYVVEVR